MRYLLATSHAEPKFYKPDATVIAVELNYVQRIIVSSADEHGHVTHTEIRGTAPVADNVWLVASVDEALEILKSVGVYPFTNKQAAKLFAKNHGLSSFRYIPVP